MAGESAGALRQVFAEFGIQWDDRQLREGAQSLDGVIGRVREFAGMLAGAEVVQAIRQFAEEFEGAAGQIEDTANALDVTTTQLQEVQLAATASGLSADAASAALQRLQASAVAAADGTGAQADAFRRLGVQTRDASGQTRSISDLLDDLAPAFGRISDPAQRAALAQDLFGRQGRRLATVLHDGEGGLASLRAQLAELGGGIYPEAIEAAGKYGDATDRLRVAQQSLRSTVAVALLPILTRLTDGATSTLASLSRFTRGTNLANAALAVFGAGGAVAAAQMLRAWLPVLSRFGGIVAVLSLVALVIDDIITLARGGDSVIGRFLDAHMGAGTAAAAAMALRDSWEGVTLATHDAGQAMSDLRDFYREANNDLRPIISQTGDWIRTTFRGAFDSVAQVFGTTWDGIVARVTGFFSGIGRQIGRLADAAGLTDVARRFQATAADVGASFDQDMRGTAGGRLLSLGADLSGGAGGAAGLLAEWRDILSSRPATTAPTAAPGRPTQVTNNRTTTNNITIDGARDPAAVVDEIERRTRAIQDGDHPVGAED